MRRLIFLLFFSFLFAKTIVVDDDYRCIIRTSGFEYCFGNCKDGDYVTDNIQDAIDHSQSGDTIEICSGTYNEAVEVNVSNLTIKGVDGQAIDDVEVKNSNDTFTLKAENITLENFKIVSSDSKGIYGVWEGGGSNNFNYLIVKSKLDAINLSRGDTQYFSNLDINSTDGYGIYLAWNVQGDHEFSDLNISAAKDGIYSAYGGKKFINLEINASERGIFLDNSKTDITFDTLKIISEKNGIEAGSAVEGNHILKNLDITSKSENGVVFSNGFSSFSASKIVADDKGISFKPDRKVSISNIEINTTNDIGLELKYSDNAQDINITDVNISAGGDNLYVNNSNSLYMDNLLIENGNKGIYLAWNVKGITLKNSLIKNCADWDLDIEADPNTPGEITQNCFYGDKEVYSKGWGDTQHHFSQNYFDGVSDTNGNGCIDNDDSDKLDGTFQDCAYALSCGKYKAVLSYRMDECSWDDDVNTYEIKNSGTLGNDYNATSLNEANVTDGKICNGGDINSTTTDKAVRLKTNYSLPSSYTLNLWIYFPLNLDGHKNFGSTGRTIYYFNIADRVGSDNDFIYFSYERRGNNETWKLVVKDDSDSDEYDLNPQELNGWHMLTFIVNENGTDFYLDKEKKNTFSTHPNTGELGLLFNSDYQSNDNEPNGQSIGSKVDEFKIFNYELEQSEIDDLYEESRDCPSCNQNKNSSFNAVDYISSGCSAVDDWDNNISTKIVNASFDLTLLAKDPDTNTNQEANITKVTFLKFQSSDCSGDYKSVVVCDDSDPNLPDCPDTDSNGCASLSDLSVDNANKCVLVNIQGYYINNTDTTATESNSTDGFATRPDKFKVTNFPSQVVAEKEFNVTIKAVDKDGNSVKDYNETLSTSTSPKITLFDTKCSSGSFEIVDGGDFKDGECNVTLKYREVGDVNISVEEVDGSEFAKTDANDNVSGDNRFISKVVDGSIEFVVDSFDVDVLKFLDYDTDSNFTYLDNNLTIAALIELNITAKGAEGNITKNYNTDCYAKDIDINTTLKLTYNNQEINVTKSRFYFIDVNDNKSDISDGSEIENNLTSIVFKYTEGNFTTDDNGSTTVKIYFNFDRNSSIYSNPFVTKIDNIEVNNTDTSKTTFSADGNATFYYGVFSIDDVITKEDEFNTTGFFGFYDENESDTLKISDEVIGYNIYKNTLHNSVDGNISDSAIKIYSDYTQNSAVSGVSASVVGNSDGNLTIEIKRSDSSVDFVVVHILDSNLSWLWYSKFDKEYSISSDSTCAEHFCFSVTWERDGNNKEVGSGEFKGTESNITESNATARGVKIYR